MEQTIVENEALFAAHHHRRKKIHSASVRPLMESRGGSSLRTSVGEFAFRTTPFGCQLDLVVGAARRALGVYHSMEAALRALKMGRTGFSTWDGMGRRIAESQLNTPSRWTQGDNRA